MCVIERQSVEAEEIKRKTHDEALSAKRKANEDS
jgi:hypothetical protein